MSKNEDKTTNEKMRIENLLNPLNSTSNLQNIGVELDQDLEKIQKITVDETFLKDFLESNSKTPSPTFSPVNNSNSTFYSSDSSLSSTSSFSRSKLYRTSSNISDLSFSSRSQS